MKRIAIALFACTISAAAWAETPAAREQHSFDSLPKYMEASPEVAAPEAAPSMNEHKAHHGKHHHKHEGKHDGKHEGKHDGKHHHKHHHKKEADQKPAAKTN